MRTLNVATVAFETAWKDPEKDLEQFERDVKRVLEFFPETSIIIFPEITFSGYILDESNRGVAESMDGHIVAEVKRVAVENRIALIAGIIEKGDQAKPYNTIFAVDKNGKVLAKYRKNHLFSASREPEVYTAGEELTVFEFEGWKCGLAICFDIRFPRLFEAYKKAGVECVFIGARWVQGRNKAEIFDFMVKARAHENQNFVVTVDAKGSDLNNTYHGISIISNPYGENIATQNEIYSYVVLDKNEIETISKSLPLTISYKDNYSI